MGKDKGMDPIKWGWALQGNQFVPLTSRMNAAPDSLSFIVTAPLLVRHSVAAVENMVYHVLLPVECANLNNVTIQTSFS